MRNTPMLLGLAALALVTTNNAYAYLDPGTGSYILQIVIGGIAGAMVAAKMFFSHIRLFFAGLFQGKRASDSTSSETSTQGDKD
jgi:hypothetical protein